MKKTILLLFLSLSVTIAFGQKKKPAAKKTAAANVIAKADNLTAELTPGKEQYQFEVLLNKKDSLFTKKINVSGNGKLAATKNNNIPFDCKITPFTAKGTPLYAITWSENNVNEITDKTEDRTQIHSEIWNTATKTQVLANVQTATRIKEILWLDKLKNASQTSEKMRNEGLVFTLTKEGDVLLKSKTQENKLTYNPATNSYDNLKATVTTPASKPKKK